MTETTAVKSDAENMEGDDASLNVNLGYKNLDAPIGQNSSFKEKLQLAKAIFLPYWRSEERWRAYLMLLAILVLIGMSVTLSVWLNEWNRVFYDAVEKRNYVQFKEQLWRFSYLAFASIAIAVYRILLEQKLHIDWRRWLTQHYLARWLSDGRFYVLGLTLGKVDNPDQRISDDIDQVTGSTLSLTLGFIRNAIMLVTFSMILWTVSGALSFEFWGQLYEIPGYMFWFSLAYATVGSWMVYRLGRSLVKLNFLQQRYEANFRFRLARVREYAESIALYAAFRKTKTEMSQLVTMFTDVVKNWNLLINVNKRINVGSNFYGQFAIIFPFLVSAPRYFSGGMTLGFLFQVSSAFGRVNDAMSWFIDMFSSLASWKASFNRLSFFEAALQENVVSKIDKIASEKMAVSQLILATPQTDLTTSFDLEITAGSRIAVLGDSGCGKSTLLRTLSGMYPYGQGKLYQHTGKSIFFVPQKSYLPHADLKTALCYPTEFEEYSREQMESVLTLCGALSWCAYLDKEDNWSQRLSLGEQQRLGFARILLLRPDYVFLDEATSALDSASELHLYQALFKELPQTTFVSVTHRASVVEIHQEIWNFSRTDSGLYALTVQN